MASFLVAVVTAALLLGPAAAQLGTPFAPAANTTQPSRPTLPDGSQQLLSATVPPRSMLQQEQQPATTSARPYPAPGPVSNTKLYSPSYLACCLVAKDQSADIREWVYYHHWVGCETIYVYDHNSSMPLSGELDDWIRTGVVNYNMFAGAHLRGPNMTFRNTAQGYAYGDCLKRARGKHHWVAFIDADEYLILPNRSAPGALAHMLKGYERYGGLVVNWRVFGSSGHVERPQLPTLLAYTKCIPDTARSHNIHVKTITNVKHTLGIGPTPHAFKYRDGYFAVNAHQNKCTKPQCAPVVADHIILHHYITKSREEFGSKVARGGGSGKLTSWSLFHDIDRQCSATSNAGLQAYEACCGKLNSAT